jgi:ribosome-associated toxin RatA of RatAB toxin-antitoxin module
MNRKIAKSLLLKQFGIGYVGYITAIALVGIFPAQVSFAQPSPAQKSPTHLFNGPLDRLTGVERDSLRKGKVIISGENGKYVARVLVAASPVTVWDVLTDYENLPNFIPNMVSSKILEKNGDRKVVEQIDTRQVFFVSVRSRTKMAITETDKKQINFRLIEGDLASLIGSWTIESVSSIPGKPSNQVLITQTVEAQPNSGVPQETFYDIFKDSLNTNLTAINNESLRRSKAP